MCKAVGRSVWGIWEFRKDINYNAVGLTPMHTILYMEGRDRVLMGHELEGDSSISMYRLC